MTFKSIFVSAKVNSKSYKFKEANSQYTPVLLIIQNPHRHSIHENISIFPRNGEKRNYNVMYAALLNIQYSHCEPINVLSFNYRVLHNSFPIDYFFSRLSLSLLTYSKETI